MSKKNQHTITRNSVRNRRLEKSNRELKRQNKELKKDNKSYKDIFHFNGLLGIYKEANYKDIRLLQGSWIITIDGFQVNLRPVIRINNGNFINLGFNISCTRLGVNMDMFTGIGDRPNDRDLDSYMQNIKGLIQNKINQLRYTA